jgi:hypothetical protein
VEAANDVGRADAGNPAVRALLDLLVELAVEQLVLEGARESAAAGRTDEDEP